MVRPQPLCPDPPPTSALHQYRCLSSRSASGRLAGVGKGNRTEILTMMEVRIETVDSNAAFTGVAPAVLLATVTVPTLVFNANTVAVAGFDSRLEVASSTVQGSWAVMAQWLSIRPTPLFR